MLWRSMQPTMWMLLKTVCKAHLDLIQVHHPCIPEFCPLHSTQTAVTQTNPGDGNISKQLHLMQGHSHARCVVHVH